MVKKETIEIVRPHVVELLTIYLKIIEECDHESLLDSLKGIFLNFQNDIQPLVE